ncbi:MAG: putative DNA-binding domain-containing protein [Rudaea sp.]
MSAAPDATHARRVQFEFTAHLRDPKNAPAPAGIEDRRLAIYRELVFTNMESFIASNFPVIRSLYDDAQWDTLAREFLRDHRCHTPLFPEFAREFLRYIEARQHDRRDDPPFLLELAHYEWAELALSLDETDIEAIDHDADGSAIEGVPVVSPLICVLAYHFPVHCIRADFRPTEPAQQPTVLLLVRGRDDQVRFHEINALGAMLIERLQANSDLCGRECLDAVLAQFDAATAADLRPAGLALLAELQEREAILGTQR